MRWIYTVLISFCLLAAGCGQKGDLYLPGQKNTALTQQTIGLIN